VTLDVDSRWRRHGLEAHPETDQFLRLDAGNGRVQMGPAKDNCFGKGSVKRLCVLVPAGPGTTSPIWPRRPMQSTIYAPAHHTPTSAGDGGGAEADKDDDQRPSVQQNMPR